MVSMKKTKKEKAEMISEAKLDAPEYPYGLRISLDSDSMEKLGFSNPLAVGKKLKVEAMVEVVSSSKYDSQSGTNVSMELQITEMELEQEKESSAKRLYSKE
jgi:hypothetical protein